VAAQVATGIGFVGAGAIINSGISVRGLTTATTLRDAAAVGVAAGAGAYVPAAAAMAAVFAVLPGVWLMGPAIMRRSGAGARLLELEYERGHGTLGPLVRGLERMDARIGPLHDDGDGDGGNGMRRLLVEVRSGDDQALQRLVADMSERGEVRAATATRGRLGWNGSDL
jgi:putative Mg2+ transporter-C (MgtC) family protein